MAKLGRRGANYLSEVSVMVLIELWEGGGVSRGEEGSN